MPKSNCNCCGKSMPGRYVFCSRCKDMTELQRNAFKKVLEVWTERYPEKQIDKDFWRKLIVESDLRGDMKKPVHNLDDNKIYLVPIEDVILYGLKGTDLGTKYTETDNNA